MPFAPRASTLCAPKAVAPIGNIGHDCAQSACTCSFSAVTAALAGAASSPRRAEHLLRKLLRALPKSRTLSPLSKPMCAIIFAFAHCAPFSSQSLGPFQWLCFALYHYVLILSPPSRSFIDDILGFVTAPCLCIGALIIPTSSTLLPRGLLPTSQHPFHSSTSYIRKCSDTPETTLAPHVSYALIPGKRYPPHSLIARCSIFHTPARTDLRSILMHGTSFILC
jgi:hypothetical protein